MVDAATATAAEDEIAAAVREAGEARALAEALAERVRNGGEVQPGELRNARELAELAELRVEAAHRRAERAREAERARLLAELAADVAAHDTAGDALADDLATAAAALEQFVTRTRERNAALRELHGRALALDVSREPAGTTAGLAVTDGGGLAHNGRRISPLDPGPLVAAVVYRLATTYDLRASGARLPNLLPDLIGPDGPHDLGEFIRRYA